MVVMFELRSFLTRMDLVTITFIREGGASKLAEYYLKLLDLEQSKDLTHLERYKVLDLLHASSSILLSLLKCRQQNGP